MSITDELRQVAAKTEEANGRCGKLYRGDLDNIADRIDAEHESKVSYWQETSYKDGYDEGFASADDYFTDKRETLKEHGWVKLPLDADGVPWYRGSRVIDPKDPDGKVNTVWIAGDNTLITDEHVFIFRANELRHHRPPTVEDVLREFAIDWECSQDGEDKTAVLKEYAAKLRLAGDGE